MVVLWLAATVAASNDAHAAPLLIVSADAGGEVVFVDPVKAQVVERVKVGARPRGLKLAKNRKQLFVAVSGPAKSAARRRPARHRAVSPSSTSPRAR